MKDDYVNKLLDDVERIRERDKKSYGDLARELTASSSERRFSYSQVYDWLHIRRFKPRTEAFLALLRWRDANLSGAIAPSLRQLKLRAQTIE